MWKNFDMDMIVSFSGFYLRVVFDDNFFIEVFRLVIIKWVVEVVLSMGIYIVLFYC